MSTATETRVRTRGGRVLLVSADERLARDVSGWLTQEYLSVQAAESLDGAIDHCARSVPDVALLDLQLPGVSVAEAFERLRSAAGDVSVVAVCGDDLAGLDVAVTHGAVDFLVRPLDRERLCATSLLALRVHVLERENRRLAEQLQTLQWGQGLIGCSPAIRRLAGALSRAAQSDVTVLLEGAAGTGKSLAARVIHVSGRRADRPLIGLDASGLDEEALETQLRGESGGTLVVEDVDRLCARAQGRFVRYLKEQVPETERSRRMRVVATTSARLPEAVAKGSFREDLYYRLNVYPVRVPSLEERREDIMLLASHFLRRSAEETGVAENGFTPSATVLLETHPWPGNVGQLQSAIYRAHSLAKADPVDRVHLLGPATGLSIDVPPPALQAARGDEDEEEVTERDILPLEQEEKRLLGRALRATGGNVRRAAQLLRIGRATLYRKIQLYKLRLH